MSLRLLSRSLSTDAAAAAAVSSYLHLLRSNATLPHLEATLTSDPTPLSPSTVLSVLSLLSPSNPSLALRFFVWSALHPDLRPLSPSLFSLASSSLSLPLRPSLPHSLLDLYRSHSLPVSLPTFKALLSLCRPHPLPDLALSLLRRLPDFQCRPDTAAFNSVLRLLSSPGRGDAVLTLLNEMSAAGLRPDNITYVSAVRGLCADGRFADARRILTQMPETGCRPNVVVYSAIVDGACNCGDINAAMEIVKEMEEGGECVPNVVTYTCLMKCLCESGRLDEALGVLDRMGRRRCWPNRVTVGTLVKGFCKEGRVDGAYEVIERVVGEGTVTSEECYSLLVVCLLKVGNRMAAEGVLGKMLAGGVRPDGSASNSLLRELCEERCFLDGYRWLGKLEEKRGNVVVDSDVYGLLLAGLCKERHLDEAVVLGRRVVERKVQVDAGIVGGVVEVLEKIGKGDLASQIMKLKRA